MRAVVDTNVIVSAAIQSSGPSAAVMRAVEHGELTLITSPALLVELQRVLAYPRVARRTGWTAEQRAEFVAALAITALLVTPAPTLRISRDEADNRVLEAAVAGQADYIISGDKDLLSLDQFQTIPLIEPATFLRLLEH